MILPKIDRDRFLVLVAFEPLIAFQRLEYGWAVAAPGEAYYAPATHSGGGNLDGDFVTHLGHSFLTRMGKPALRTLRPTAQPTPKVIMELNSISGDDPIMIEFATQVVIQAIEEHGRPDLQATVSGLKREAMIEALERVREQAAFGLEAVEGAGGPKVTLHLMQCAAALKFALELLLKP